MFKHQTYCGVDVRGPAFAPVGAASSRSYFQSASRLRLIGCLANEGSCKSEAAHHGDGLKQLCPTECALTNSSNEHFLYCQYYFSMYKRSGEVKPDCLRNSI